MIKHAGFIYKITNLINGKIYFGLTKCSIKKRWNEHKCVSRNDDAYRHLYSSMKKYGTDNFKIEKVKTCHSDKQLYASEIYFIKLHNTTNSDIGYNKSTGGEASNKGFKHSDETKIKLSRPCSDKTKEKLRIINTGRKNVHKKSDELRKQMSDARKGSVLSPEHRRKISETMKKKVPFFLGKKHSEETKKKISIKHTGRVASELSKIKMSEFQKNRKRRPATDLERKRLSDINKGKKLSEETKKRMSDSHLRIHNKTS